MSKHLYKVLPLLLLVFSYACGNSVYYGSSQATCKYVDIETIPESIYLDVTYIKQQPNYCGPASLSMLMSYYGYYVDQETLGSDIVGDSGVSSFDLIAKAKEYMFNGGVIECSLSGVLSILAEGKPVIARISNNAGTGGHFVVLTGYDKVANLIYLNDPDQPYRRYASIEEFERLWNITNLTDGENSSNLIIFIYPSFSNVAEFNI